MHRQVIFSVLASLGICSIITHMPGMGGSVEDRSSILMQAAAVLLLVLDLVIILLSGHMLEKDRLQQGEEQPDVSKSEKRKKYRSWQSQMETYASYDEQKEGRKSLLYTLVVIPAAGFCIWKQYWWGLVLSTFTGLFLLKQHRIGYSILKQRLEKEILRAFPSWMLDLILLLQSENVAVAIARSREGAPEILQREIGALSERMDQAAEDVMTYQGFLAGFPQPQIRRAMTGLYLMVTGNGDEEGRQLQDLIRINQDMQDESDTQYLREQSSGLDLLFLAPVLTASLKLLVDMGIYLIRFLAVI